MSSREDLVLEELKNFFKHNDIFYIRTNPQNGIGIPDLIACVNGKFFGIEVKDNIEGSYRMTQAQYRRLESIVYSGGVGCLVDKNNVLAFEDNICRKCGFENQRFGYNKKGY